MSISNCSYAHPENSHHRVKYHCTADLLFGVNQTNKADANSTWVKQLNPNKIKRRSAVQWYFPLSWVFSGSPTVLINDFFAQKFSFLLTGIGDPRWNHAWGEWFGDKDRTETGRTKVGRISRLRFFAFPAWKAWQLGSGCGSVGRAVASDTRGPPFECSHEQNLYWTFYCCQLYWKDENKE